MKKLLLLVFIAISVISYSQYGIEIAIVYYEATKAEDVKFYRDSLRNEYEKKTFYFIQTNGDKVDGMDVINDLSILYKRYAEAETKFFLEERHQKLLLAAKENYKAKNYKKAVMYYKRVVDMFPEDEKAKKLLKKAKKKLKKS